MLRTQSIRLAAAALAFAIICGVGTPASAQYFGRNKVQYRTFDFEVLKTEHFDIYFYPSERTGVDIAARLAERWRVRLGRLFQHELRGRQPLILYGSHVEFEQTNVIGGEIGEGTGGVTEGIRRRIVLPLAGPLADTDHVIGHELVHAFQYDIAKPPDSGPGENGVERLPLWFIEGMAEYFSIGPVDPNTAMWLRDAARREKLPSIKDLDNPKYFPYRWGQALWAYIGGRWGDEVIGSMLTVASRNGIEEAFQQVLGVPSKQVSEDWQASIRKAYAPIVEVSAGVGETGKLVIQGKELGADLNVGPAISPDGRWLAFLSTRSFFSVDLFVADAATGRIVRRLTSTSTDPHFSSVQFIQSSGAWDNASEQIAVATVTGGHATLAIFNAQRGGVAREIPVRDVDEIMHPNWSPDGRAICFTGMHQGITDLFVYDLQNNRLRQLTKDAFADLEPAWSPDGRRIAFSTDRFTSNMATLSFGANKLATIDVESGMIEQVSTLAEGKQINAQWSPDGRSLYFISDRDGIPNIYRATFEGAETQTTQVTSVTTGVSGITSLSPAMSVAAKTGTVAFSVYQDSKYDIRTIDGNVRGTSIAPATVNAAVLPPLERKESDVSSLLAAPETGLPETPSNDVEPYRTKFSLTGVAQPVVGVGVSRFGTSFGGGLALTFGDVLGNHILATAIQINSNINGSTSVKDIGAQVAYMNMTRRWNWGLVGGQIPYLSNGFQSSVGRLPSGDVVQSDQLFVFRQTERTASGVLSYPLDRSSRMEFQGGMSSISFDQVVTTTVTSLNTGRVYENTTETTPLADTLNLGTSSAAYVFDTSVFGATSPVQGQRYRFEASPTFGTINFTGLLADYRRYFMPAPFYTLAIRGMHYGRYGSGSEDTRIAPLYVGYPWLVRGYDVSSIGSEECIPTATGSCQLIDRLLGSRMLVANAEFRFPLLRPFGVSGNMYGPLPIEVALFADAGTAWNQGETPSLHGGSRGPVSSAGVALRVNLMGFAIGELDMARAFARPGHGWVFGFNLMPGW
jgi:surface antigen Omp85-like protein/WD40 repeat protein